jgi:hypothetical protein
MSVFIVVMRFAGPGRGGRTESGRGGRKGVPSRGFSPPVSELTAVAIRKMWRARTSPS